MAELIPFIACILIAFGIGSNDTSNALGICIGAGIIKLRKAVLLFGCFVLIGLVLQGQKVMKTVGKDLLEVTPSVLSISLSISALFIILFNWKKLPLSTHQVLIGGLTGSGIASGIDVNVVSLLKIVLSWIISPLTAFFFSFILYKMMEKTLSRLSFFRIERILRILLLISGILIAYNTGANELATVLGPVIYSGLIGKMQSFLLGAFFVFLGSVLLSSRVIETVGKGITALDPYSGFAAQLGAGSCVLLFTFLGMPISTTYCIIGGISGVGMVKGMKTVRMDLIKKMIINWAVAPSIAFISSFILMRIVRYWS
ncbi:MAG: phosphate permease [Nitrospirae bacterium RBG_13_43_8]|nr:MAG: phosphate permease [Nitrospirae bacterium RBG_13_43_8]